MRIRHDAILSSASHAHLVVVPGSAKRFEGAPVLLGRQPLFARRGFGARRPTLFGSYRGTSDQRDQATARRLSILRLRTIDPAVDEQHAVSADAPSSSAMSRCFRSGGSDETETSNRTWTAVASLLTFWPPGPVARTKCSSTSLSGSRISPVIVITSRTL